MGPRASCSGSGNHRSRTAGDDLSPCLSGARTDVYDLISDGRTAHVMQFLRNHGSLIGILLKLGQRLWQCRYDINYLGMLGEGRPILVAVGPHQITHRHIIRPDQGSADISQVLCNRSRARACGLIGAAKAVLWFVLAI